MIVNFVGNYQSGYVGEVSDETHLAREIEALGHTIRRIPRDEWREYVIEGKPEGKYPGVPTDLKADINIICKWHHFYDETFINTLKELSGAPAFYWVWDYMYDGGFPEWHIKTAKSADLYLSNEGGLANEYAKLGIRHYYFPFDVCDGDITRYGIMPKQYDVVFTGTYLGQGDRIEWLKEINKKHKITVFSWNHEEWIKNGFEAYPAVYGEKYNEVISRSKIVLGLSVNAHCWGYWSNRVGKVLRAGGFLLQQYAPGMELLLGDRVEYFSSPQEAIDKISDLVNNDYLLRKKKWDAADEEGAFTSKNRVKQLMILCERYTKEDPSLWNKMP